MASEINTYEFRDKIINSQGPNQKFTYKIRKNPKTPENIYNSNNNIKHYKKNTLNFRRRKISTINLDPNIYFQPLNLTKEQNQNGLYDTLYKKYLITITKYEQIISELSNTNKKLDDNNDKFEELKQNLKKLKENKKQKQRDIVNLLSNKESLEEVFKNKVYYLIENKDLNNKKKEIYTKEKDKWGIKDGLENEGKKKDSKGHISSDSEIYKIDGEEELIITIEDIKISDKKKFMEQVINFTEDIFQRNEDEFNNKIKEKINLAYKAFFTGINSSSSIDSDSIISNFFSRIGVYISNHSLGNYSEININKFLRYLLKINSIGTEIFQIIKFLNKKYKEQKIEIKEQINYLTKKIENLTDKKKNLDKKLEELEEKIEKRKKNLKNFEQKRDNYLENEKNKYINITSDGLYSASNINNFRKLRIFSEKINEVKNNNNNNKGYDNIYCSLQEANNSKGKKYSPKNKIQNNNLNAPNEKNSDNKSKYLSNDKTKKNILKIKPNNPNNNSIEENIKKENNNPLSSKENAISNKETKDKEFQEKELYKKIKIGLDKIKPNKININRIFKLKNKKLNDNNNLRLLNSNHNINNINIQNNFNEINSNPNNMTNINDQNNNRINLNNLVINNDIKIKNINDIIKPVKENKNQNQNQEKKSDTKKQKNNNKIYYYKKVENIKLKNNRTNDNNNIFKNIIVNNRDNKEQIRDKDDKNEFEFNKESNLYNRNSFNCPNNQQINKNIYIINNINNSEQYNSKDNVYSNTQYRNINIGSKPNQRTEILNDYNEYNNKTFDKSQLSKKIENIKNNNDAKKEKGNHNYNFHDILRGNNKDTIKNRLLNNINFEKLKLIPIKKLDKIKIRNFQNSPPLYLQINKKNRLIFQKNNFLFNTNEGNNITKVKKKLTDSHIVEKNNDGLNMDMNLISNNNKVKIN